MTNAVTTVTKFERRPHTGPYPHEPCCPKCREVRLCNICGDSFQPTWGAGWSRVGGHCTNGHCSPCHNAVCSPGGAISPGHGHGSPQRRMKRHQRTTNREGG